MFLFNSHEGGLANRKLPPAGDEAGLAVQKKRSLFAALNGEEQPRLLAGLLFVLVGLLHVWLALWLLMPTEITKKPDKVIIEVSMVSVPGQKAEITPPVPPKPEPPKPEPPKKEAVKPPVKKKMPVIPKQVTPPKQAVLPKPQPQVEQQPPVAVPTAVPTPHPVSRPAPAVASSEPRISTGVIPLERIPPKYPARAANRHIEGWVKIEFTITTTGTVKDAVVVEAEPEEIFDEAALKAIDQWTFKEKTVNGVAVEQRAVQTLQFKLTR